MNWDLVMALVGTALDLCTTGNEVDRVLADNKRALNEMGRARPDLWQQLGARVATTRAGLSSGDVG